ncbi:MAG: SpoIIE family protein phosphatase [Spirochaetaceae bacterium]|jgi:serine phosphatase RsbU (regulator of sigma subunit)|nr:SpoIIE family protein phosphatase [Spirochaetaceae bacterium]
MNLFNRFFQRFFVFFSLFAAAGHIPAQDFYWDVPEQFLPEFTNSAHFPQPASGAGTAAIAWQETEVSSRSSASEYGNVYISLAVATSNGADGGRIPQWSVYRRVAGPYPYGREEPWLYNICVDKRGRIILAVAASASVTEILISEDRGKTFRKRQLSVTNANDTLLEAGAYESLAPRIFPMENGGYLMFVGRSVNQALTLYYARSTDAFNWTPFELFTAGDSGLTLNFLPTHASFSGTEYVVFQSYVHGADNRISFQLFLKTSADGGITWTPARRITNFRDPLNTAADPAYFGNERPHIIAHGDNLFLVWERKYISSGASVYALTLNSGGDAVGRAERVNQTNAACMSPISVEAGGRLCVLWFDNRRGLNSVMMAVRSGTGWEERIVSGAGHDSMFASPTLAAGNLYVFWQDGAGSSSRIYYREQDREILPPAVKGLNFTANEATRSTLARITWERPSDPSGVRGYSWVWSQKSDAIPPPVVSANSDVNSVEVNADADGAWYFIIRASDNAGNWSAVSSVVFLRDTTPPLPPLVTEEPADNAGYLLSNTFTLRWQNGDASDVTGYYWQLDAIPNRGDGASEWRAYTASLPPPNPEAGRNMGMRTSLFYDDIDNGAYRFRVYALDYAGNVSAPALYYFRLNKYVPRTYITFIDSTQDIQGKLAVLIRGRGFSEGGAVNEIEFRRAGEKAAERVIRFNAGEFTIRSDHEIFIPGVEHLKGGEYYISIRHPVRGTTQSSLSLVIGRTQTVKFGDFSLFWSPEWRVRETRRYTLDSPVAVFAVVFAFGLALVFLSVRTARFVIREQNALKLEAAALLYGNFMPVDEKEMLMRKQKQRRRGLRFKLTLFTATLVIFVVALVSVPLYYMMIVTERAMLLDGLYSRSRVLLEALGASARVFLPANNVLELGYLPDQSMSIPEARYVTITGYGEGATTTSDYVWATNDPDIFSKIDTAEFEPGVSRITDTISPFLEAYQDDLNARAAESIGTLAQTVSGLNAESLSLFNASDAESLRRISDIQRTVRTLETRIVEILDIMNKDIRSEPAFTLENHQNRDGTFLLYKPVLFRQGASDIYVRGMIRLEISTVSIHEDLRQRQMGIFRIILTIALGALVIGFSGALALSSIIVGPVKALVSHVEKIRDTEDKSKLEGEDIIIKSRDELAVLANTINDMTHGLVKAAIASHDLIIGKEIQKKFIPLEIDSSGDKKTFGYSHSDKVRFFGYYEGAKGVSGDYFDYRDLDGRYYAIIKCDVAGKGVPAALIMAQVATMFINYFNGWKASEKNFQIETLVYQINAFIENLGFKGRFAAFTLCLLDSETGLARFCNAGDNIIHLYDDSEQKMKRISLPQTPATGILPNDMVSGAGGYHVDKLYIDHGDILLLYTDGIEESKRKFRNSEYEEIVCTYENAPNDTPHENHVVGQADEEMGVDRVEAIIEAVMNNSSYHLFKHHNPEGDIEYHFDFSDCRRTVEEVIMAMVSVEKIFRMYPRPAFETARVLVDSKVDAFLKDHFLEYNKYCALRERFLESGNYLYYLRTAEDEQYDDLTMLGIKRK